MPLIRRQPFIKRKPPPDLRPDEEVFHCKLTNEIFRDYEAFFERIILCNSLVWTCSVTGKPGLTYQEALESEEKARKSLSAFPEHMRKAILCIATLTHRTRLNDMNEDVYLFAKDRFFVGELVEVHHRYQRRTAKVIKIMVPKFDAPKVGKVPESISDDDDVVILEKPRPEAEVSASDVVDLTLSDSENDVMSSSAASLKSPTSQKPIVKTLDPELYNYMVTFLDRRETVTVRANQINRKKGTYTRDKSKLFLKQHCEPGEGIWRVKRRNLDKFKITDDTFEEIYAGPRPVFVSATIKRRPAGSVAENKEQELKAKKSKKAKPMTVREISEIERATQQLKELEEAELQARAGPVKKKLTPEERADLLERIKEEKLKQRESRLQQLEEMKVKRRAEKEAERIKVMEERRIRAEYLREWNRPRDDLECDDLQLLPEPTPISTWIPESVFGDALMLVEFFRAFETIVDVSDVFPDGVTISVMEKVIKDKDVNGALYDMVKSLLTTIFELQEEEDIKEADMLKELSNLAERDDVSSDLSMKYLIQTATQAAKIPYTCHGTSLAKLALDPYTITEVVRLHFQSSGARATVMNAKFRYQERGGYTCTDDAGLELRMREPQLLKHLSKSNMFDLGPVDRMKILVTLTDQIMSYTAARDIVEDYAEQLRMARTDLRQLQITEQKIEREEQAIRWRRRLEEKAREQEKQQALLQQKIKEREAKLVVTSNPASDLAIIQAAAATTTKSATTSAAEDSRTSCRLKEKSLIAEEEEIAKIIEKLVKKSDDPLSVLMSMSEEGLTPTQVTLLDEQRKQYRNLKREEIKKEQEELLDAVTKLQFSYANYPLGRDRLFRRYWLFAGTDGLFVEDQEEHVPDDYIKPVRQNATYNPHANNSVQQLASLQLAQLESNAGASISGLKPQPSVQLGATVQLVPTIGGVQCGPVIMGKITQSQGVKVIPGAPVVKATTSCNSDKENLVNSSRARLSIVPSASPTTTTVTKIVSPVTSSPVKVVPPVPNGSPTLIINSATQHNGTPHSPVRIITLSPTKSVSSPVFTSPAAAKSEALRSPVKAETAPNAAVEQIVSRRRVRWAYYSAPDALQQLVIALNLRGVRERELRQTLTECRDTILKKMATCKTEMFKTKSSIENDEKVCTQSRLVALPSNYRKLKSQGIVKDDSAQEQMELTLREMLLDMEERIYFGSLGSVKVTDRQLWRGAIEQGSYMALIEPDWYGKLHSDQTTGSPKMDTSESRDDEDTASQAVRDLCKGLLQVKQGVDKKYLNPPLGEPEKDKKSRHKAGAVETIRKEERRSKGSKKDSMDADSNEKDDGSSVGEETGTRKISTLERWEESLMSSTSLCQIYLHMATLETSIAWSKSALHARCRICRRKGDAEKMLLCDMCDRGHHMYCLKPVVTRVPQGDWFCPQCRPKDNQRTPRKLKRARVYMSDDDDLDAHDTFKQDSEEEEKNSDQQSSDAEVESHEDEDEERGSESEDESDEESQVVSEEEEEEIPPKIKMKTCKRSNISPAPKVTGSATRKGVTPVNAPGKKSTPGSGAKRSSTSQNTPGNSGAKRSSTPQNMSGNSGAKRSSTPQNMSGNSGAKRSSTPQNMSGSSSRRTSRASGAGANDSYDELALGSGRKSKGRVEVTSSRPNNKRKSMDTNGSVEGENMAAKNKRLSDGSKVVTSATSSRTNESHAKLRLCEELVQEMIRMDDAWPFLKPVSKKEAPDYMDVIDTPMDFSKIRMNINNHLYNDASMIVSDVRLMLRNCEKYNIPAAPQSKAGVRLGKLFEKKLKELRLVGGPVAPRRTRKN